jgi:hypothetical protein
MTLDRYLRDVRVFLPADQADDIVNELSENLRAQFEDREMELGRPLTEAEQEAILADHGKPLVVAARYRTDEQSFAFGRTLIGPALFPAYTQVLTIVFSVTFFVVLIGAIVAGAGESLAWQPFAEALPRLALAAVIQFGVITAIFVGAERAIIGDPSRAALEFRTAFPSGPQSLLERIADQLIGRKLGDVVPRRTSVADFAIVAITAGWLLLFVRPPIVIDALRSGPGLENFHVPLLVVIALSGVQPLVTFVRPRLVTFRSVARLTADLAVLALFVLSLNTGQWIAPTVGAASDEVQRLASEINRWIGISLTVAILITLVMAAFELYRLVERLRHGSAATAVA